MFRRYAADRLPALRDEIVERFMPLARSLAMRYRNGAEPLDDLIQVASIGLVKAVERFDADLGRSFTAFAVPTILGELRRHFRDRVWNLRLPRRLQELTMRVEAAIDDLTGDQGRAPSATEIAAHLKIETGQVLEALAAGQARRTLSFDAPRPGAEEGAPTVETVGGIDPGYEQVETQIAASSADLDAREQQVLKLHVVDRLTQREVGQMLGLSQMTISRISRGALEKLLVAVQ